MPRQTRKPMVSRKEKHLREVLRMNLSLPYNQRPYAWKKPDVSKYTQDILTYYTSAFEGELGQFIFLDYDNEISIWDGQQRILTTIIFFIALSKFNPQVSNDFLSICCLNEIDISEEDNQERRNEFSDSRVPRVRCVYKNDREALSKIVNKKFLHKNEYTRNDEGKYTCQQTGDTFTSITSLERHVKHWTNTSCLYKAYEAAYNTLDTFFKENENQINKEKYVVELYNFIIDQINVNVQTCEDPDHASILFEQCNNRGASVETLDIIKNFIIRNLRLEAEKQEVFDRFDTLRNTSSSVTSKYGDKLFTIAVQIMNGELTRKAELPRNFNEAIINQANCYEKCMEFFQIVERLDGYMRDISEDYFGCLINKKVKITWEGYQWALLPIGFSRGEINSDLIHLFVKYAIRYIPFKTKKSFNSMVISNKFLEISNKVLGNPEYDYLNAFATFLDERADPQLIPDNFIATVCGRTFDNDEAKNLLAFIECSECKQHDIPVSDTKLLSLEHIIPQSTITENSEEIIKSLGNVTLLEHGYNIRLQDKAYNEKKELYSKSVSQLTCEIAKDYETFTLDHVNERTRKLAERLEEASRYFTVEEEEEA